MLESDNIPPVRRGELLARAVIASGWIRRSDNTVKADAFIPHPHKELSLTRHLGATDQELWDDCRRIAGLVRKTLYGRADVSAGAFEDQGLVVEAEPIPENPNHSNAKNWPDEKPAQKMKAILIAMRARFLPAPHAP